MKLNPSLTIIVKCACKKIAHEIRQHIALYFIQAQGVATLILSTFVVVVFFTYPDAYLSPNVLSFLVVVTFSLVAYLFYDRCSDAVRDIENKSVKGAAAQ